MSNDVLATLQNLKSHFLLQLSEMPEYRAMKALEKTIAEVSDILNQQQVPAPVEAFPQPIQQVVQQAVQQARRPVQNETEQADYRSAEAAIAGVIPARTASPTALRIPTMPLTRRF
jgi:hypothetical protein